MSRKNSSARSWTVLVEREIVIAFEQATRESRSRRVQGARGPGASLPSRKVYIGSREPLSVKWFSYRGGTTSRTIVRVNPYKQAQIMEQ